jgi:hypothetical protein
MRKLLTRAALVVVSVLSVSIVVSACGQSDGTVGPYGVPGEAQFDTYVNKTSQMVDILWANVCHHNFYGCFVPQMDKLLAYNLTYDDAIIDCNPGDPIPIGNNCGTSIIPMLNFIQFVDGGNDTTACAAVDGWAYPEAAFYNTWYPDALWNNYCRP